MRPLAPFKAALEKIGLYVWRTPPRGADLFFDIRSALPKLKLETVFDVGGNIGQSVDKYLKVLPGAVIHSFEPVQATFDHLKARFAGNSLVHAHHLALGADEGQASMALEGPSDTFRIQDSIAAGVATETVPMTTLDRLCADQSIGHINFLKIDTEGFDLEVLKGAKQMLKDGNIDLVQVEAGLSPRHDWHVPFEVLKAFLEGQGHHLFSIVDQAPNFVPGAPYLQRCDAVFVSDRMVDLHRRS